MSEEECICQGKCPGEKSDQSELSEEPSEDGFSLEDVPELVLKKILEKIPRRNGFQNPNFFKIFEQNLNPKRELEDSLIDVNYLFQSLVTDILSGKDFS